MDNSEKLKKFRKAVEEAKADLQRQIGVRSQILADLKSNYGLSSIEEAKARKKVLDDLIVVKQKELETIVMEIERDYIEVSA